MMDKLQQRPDINILEFKRRCLRYGRLQETAFADLNLTADTINYSFPEENGRTLLGIATIQGDVGAVTKLLSIEGVNPNIADNQGRTPLIAAARLNYLVVEALLRHVNIDPLLQDNAGLTAHAQAQQANLLPIVELLAPFTADANAGNPNNDRMRMGRL